jgi:hypothetical protein
MSHRAIFWANPTGSMKVFNILHPQAIIRIMASVKKRNS